MSRIDMNPSLCDAADGEVTQPPVSLRMQDLRDEYSVQTSAGSSLYFNYSTLTSTPDIVMEKLAVEAKAAFTQGLEELSLRFTKHQALSGFPGRKLGWKPIVMTYEELLERVREEMGDGLDDVLTAFDSGPGRQIQDPRDYSLEMVREVHRHLQDQSPKVILYYSPPYYPHIYVNGADDKERGLIRAVGSAVQKTRQEFGYDIVMRKFYPYILDISYCRMPSEEGAIDALKKNMPAWGKRYELPVKSIKGLSMPVVNIGPFGRDAHKPTERVSKSYSFDAMPMLLETVIAELMS
jgi:arginine utilization protein RocB